jgi:hypothetical protein
MFDFQVLNILKYVGLKTEELKKERNSMQFLALLEAIAGVVNPANISDVVALVEKLVALGEQASSAVKQSQQ